MRKSYIVLFIIFFILCSQAQAFWIWTRETQKWVNPKYAAKENPQAQFEYAMEFFNAGQYKIARSEFLKLIKYYPKSFEAAESQYYLGRCLEQMGKPYEAFKAYQKVIDKYPFSERITEIIEKQYSIGEELLEQKTSLWQYISGVEYPVIEVFRAVINNAPYSKYAPASYYKIGLFLKEMNSYSEAIDEFNKIISEYPQSEWVDRAKYQIAICEYKESLKPDYDQSKTKEAAKKLEEFVKVNPDMELSKKAKEKINQLKEKEAESNFNIGVFYEKQNQFESAKIYYRYVINNYPQTIWAAKSFERLEVIGTK
jgi:TolA-binding protein